MQVRQKSTALDDQTLWQPTVLYANAAFFSANTFVGIYKFTIDNS